ncbi:MAG: LD-carboxypeptidase [Desulfobacterales bacterium]|nr:LD-carboxypeptidase [Desulfobacterales bacterium]
MLPRRLMPGDTVAIVAPASPVEPDRFARGVAVIRSMGYEVRIPDEICLKNGYLAGSDGQRAALLCRMMTDPGISAVFCARGGFGSMKLLPLLDYALIRANPKIFVGFSDITALVNVLSARCGWVTFHGPMVSTLADASARTLESLAGALSSDAAIEIVAENPAVVKPGTASGRVVGGNLATLCHLLGTGYEPMLKGHILLMEETGEAPYRIDRMLTQMKLAGYLDGVAGVVLGGFDHCGSMSEISDLVAATFQDEDIPIVSGFEIGHGRNNLTVPIGLEAILDAGRQTLTFESRESRVVSFESRVGS